VSARKGAKRVAIFFWEGYLSVAPSMINAVRAFAEAGYLVDVITRPPPPGCPDEPDLPPRVRILRLGEPRRGPASQFPARSHRRDRHIHEGSAHASRVLPGRVGRVGQRVLDEARYLSERLEFVRFGLKSVHHDAYTAFVGVDMSGLAAATAVGLVRRTSVIYWSLEIFLLSEFRTPAKRIIKRIERICHRRAMLTVVQDSERARVLLSENGAASQRVVVVPNTPAGPAPRVAGHYLRDKFNLSAQQRVILHTGGVCRSNRTLELAQAASAWPSNWTLVLHSHIARDSSDPEVVETGKAGQGRVALSLDPVPYEALDEVISSADVGVVLYPKARPHYANVWASGKLAHYLRCGLPVVCVDVPGLGQLLKTYRCGLVVDSPDEIAGAVETALQNREAYSRNAVRCYEEVFEFGRHFRHLLRAIEANAV
jgi:glycosyltransferase involved in cell wall biosynthesis